MPRPRTTNRHHSFDDSLRVEVQVEDERLLISCGKGQDSVHWLADKVFQQYSAIRNEALGGKVRPPSVPKLLDLEPPSQILCGTHKTWIKLPDKRLKLRADYWDDLMQQGSNDFWLDITVFRSGIHANSNAMLPHALCQYFPSCRRYQHGTSKTFGQDQVIKDAKHTLHGWQLPLQSKFGIYSRPRNTRLSYESTLQPWE